MPNLPLDRIVRGDASRILPRLTAQSIDLIVTDPPYGDNSSYGPRRIRIAGNEHPLLALSVMSLSYRVLKRHATAYVFCSMAHLDFIRMFFSRYTRFRIRDVIIWSKLTMNIGTGFRKQYECILALEKGKPVYRDPKMLNLLSIRRVRSREHPHVKPVGLIKQLINHSSDEGAVVLDPFAGTGTPALAARELGRRFIGIEIDRGYCGLAQARLSPQPRRAPALSADSASPSPCLRPNS